MTTAMLSAASSNTPAYNTLPLKYRRKSALAMPVVKIEPVEENSSFFSADLPKEPLTKKQHTWSSQPSSWSDGLKLIQLNTPNDPIDVDAELGEADMDMSSTRSNTPEPPADTKISWSQPTEIIDIDSSNSIGGTDTTLCDLQQNDNTHHNKSCDCNPEPFDCSPKMDNDAVATKFINEAIIDLTEVFNPKHNFPPSVVDLTSIEDDIYNIPTKTTKLSNALLSSAANPMGTPGATDIKRERTTHTTKPPLHLDLTDLDSDDLYGPETDVEFIELHDNSNPSLPRKQTAINAHNNHLLPTPTENLIYLSLLDDGSKLEARPYTSEREDSLDRILNGEDDRYNPSLPLRHKSPITIDLAGLSPSVRPEIPLPRSSRSRSISVPLASLIPELFLNPIFRSNRGASSLPTPPASVAKSTTRARRSRQGAGSAQSTAFASSGQPRLLPTLDTSKQPVKIKAEPVEPSLDVMVPEIASQRARRKGRRKIKSALYVTGDSDVEGPDAAQMLNIPSAASAPFVVKSEEDFSFAQRQLHLNLSTPASSGLQASQRRRRKSTKIDVKEVSDHPSTARITSQSMASVVRHEEEPAVYESTSRRVRVKKEPPQPTRRSTRIPKPRIKAEIEEFALVPHNPPRKPRARKVTATGAASPPKKRRISANSNRVKAEQIESDSSQLASSTQGKVGIQIGAEKTRLLNGAPVFL